MSNANICRMYEAKFPNERDLVMVKIKEITDFGIFVSLLEYEEMEGLIPSSEISNKSTPHIKIKISKIMPSFVTKINLVSGTIDLSFKKITPEDANETEKKWVKTKTVDRIMKMASKLLSVPQIDLMSSIIWPLYANDKNPYDVFKLAALSPQDVDFLENLDSSTRDCLIEVIKKNIKLSTIKIRTLIELTCFGPEGIDGIKKTLIEILTLFPDILINIIASPLYAITITNFDSNKGIIELSNILETLNSTIKKYDGNMTIKCVPQTVSAQDEIDFKNTKNVEDSESDESD